MISSVLDIENIKPESHPESGFFSAALYLYCKRKPEFCDVFTFKKGGKNVVFLGRKAGEHISGSYLHSIVKKNTNDPKMLFTLYSIPAALVEHKKTDSFWGLYQLHGRCLYGDHQHNDKAGQECDNCGLKTPYTHLFANGEFSLD